MYSNSEKLNYSSIENVSNSNYQGASKAARRVYEGNWTFYFIIGLLSSSVFFAPFPFNKPFVEAQERQPFGPCMKTHLVGSCIISFACLWNFFHTPSHGQTYRVIHRWVGRIGLVSSIIGAVFGIITAWFERKVDFGLAIGLTVLAFMQTYYTIASYITIRAAIQKRRMNELASTPTTEEQKEEEEKLIGKHKDAVVRLWITCIAPAWFRIPQIFGASADSPMMFLAFLFTTPFVLGARSAINRGSFW